MFSLSYPPPAGEGNRPLHYTTHMDYGCCLTSTCIQQALLGMTTTEAEKRLAMSGVPCAIPAAYDTDDALADPLLREHSILVAETHPQAGDIVEVGHTIRFGTQTRIYTRPAPLLGQDTVALLKG